MSTPYTPRTPQNIFTPQQTAWIVGEFQAVKKGLESAKPNDAFQYLHAQPSRIVPGMVVLADGTDWDPGSGAGAYRRDEANTEWVFIGADEAAIEEALGLQTLNLQAISSDLQRLVFLQTEQLRQLTAVRLLLSAMSGNAIDDSEIEPATSQLAALSSIQTILALIAGVSIENDQIAIPT